MGTHSPGPWCARLSFGALFGLMASLPGFASALAIVHDGRSVYGLEANCRDGRETCADVVPLREETLRASAPLFDAQGLLARQNSTTSEDEFVASLRAGAGTDVVPPDFQASESRFEVEFSVDTAISVRLRARAEVGLDLRGSGPTPWGETCCFGGAAELRLARVGGADLVSRSLSRLTEELDAVSVLDVDLRLLLVPGNYRLVVAAAASSLHDPWGLQGASWTMSLREVPEAGVAALLLIALAAFARMRAPGALARMRAPAARSG